MQAVVVRFSSVGSGGILIDSSVGSVHVVALTGESYTDFSNTTLSVRSSTGADEHCCTFWGSGGAH